MRPYGAIHSWNCPEQGALLVNSRDLICTMLYFVLLHLFKLFTYPNKMFAAFDHWGSDNRGFTVFVCRNSCARIETTHSAEKTGMKLML